MLTYNIIYLDFHFLWILLFFFTFHCCVYMPRCVMKAHKKWLKLFLYDLSIGFVHMGFFPCWCLSRSLILYIWSYITNVSNMQNIRKKYVWIFIKIDIIYMTRVEMCTIPFSVAIQTYINIFIESFPSNFHMKECFMRWYSYP